jgi:hypothetical protein
MIIMHCEGRQRAQRHQDNQPTTPEKTYTMRKQLLSVTSPKDAQKLAPWAAKIVKVDGGYMAFESMADYQAWKRQK